jgi:hypothetical protein
MPEPTSALDAQRRELRLFATHLLQSLHDRAQREIDDADRRRNGRDVDAARNAQWFIDRITVPKIEEMIDNYSPLVDASGVEEELRPILMTMSETECAKRARVGQVLGRVGENALRARVERALRLIAGGER